MITNFMDKPLVIIIILVLFASCQKNEESERSLPYIRTEYYSSKAIKDRGAILDNLKFGLWTSYYENGNIESEFIYVNGEINGTASIYFEDGQLSCKKEWKNNIEDGESIFYYNNSNVRAKGFNKEGEIDSIWEYYTEDERLDKKIRYDMGKEVEIIVNNHLLPDPPDPPIKEK